MKPFERMHEGMLSEPDRRALYDDKVAGFWFDRLVWVDGLLGYRDKRLTGHWLLEAKARGEGPGGKE